MYYFGNNIYLLWLSQALQAELAQHESSIRETLQSLQTVSRDNSYSPAMPLLQQTTTLLNRCSHTLSSLAGVRQEGGSTLQVAQRYSADMQVRYCCPYLGPGTPLSNLRVLSIVEI